MNWTGWYLAHRGRPLRALVRVSPAMAYAIAHRAELTDALAEVAEAGGLPAEDVKRIAAPDGPAARLFRETWAAYGSGRYTTLRIEDALDAWIVAECIEGSTLPAAVADNRELGEGDRRDPVRTLRALGERLRRAVERATGEPAPAVSVPTC